MHLNFNTVSRILNHWVLLSMVATVLMWSVTEVQAQEGPPAPKRVLAIFVFKQGLPWAYDVEQSLRSSLASASFPSIELNVEYADQSRFPEEKYRSKIIDLYRYKFSKQGVDLILALGDESSELMLEAGEELFGDIPMVLVTAENKTISPVLLRPNMLPLAWGLDFGKTGALIPQLLPDTKNLFVISGTSVTDREIKNQAVEGLSRLNNLFTIEYLDDYSLENLLLKVANLPEDSAILFLSFFHDANKEYYVPRSVMSQVSLQANAPTFGGIGTYLGHGIVGGYLLSAEEQGKKYAEISEQILLGKSISEFQSLTNTNQLVFDWRQLKRWSIDKSNLPSESIIQYRELGLWQAHPWAVAGATGAILTLSFAIISLVLQYGRRSRAEEEIQKLREERIHISRVLAIGEIAASLAHELNQPLSAIRTYAQSAQRFLRSQPAKLEEANKALTGIISGNRRAEEVIKRVRMSLKKEPFQQQRLNIGNIIKELIVLLRRKTAEEKVMINLDLPLDLPPIFGDRIQLQQVLFNLAINGIEAMADETNEIHILTIQAVNNKPNIVTFSVRDNGTGIDETQADVLFDAFYSTKTEGMGMGLSISRSIIEDHGGHLWATLNKDKGTTFFFTVPVYEEDTNDTI